MANSRSWLPSKAALIACAALAVGLIAVLSDQAAAQSMLSGIGSGALIAALAIGIVLIYRGSGTVNVAVGALAMYSSYVFVLLHQDGDLLLIAWTVHVGVMPLIPALIVTLLVGAVINLITYGLIFGRIQHASAVAKLVASVGLLLIFQAIIVLQYGTTGMTVESPFGTGSLSLPGSLTVPESQVLVLGVVVLVGVILWAIFRFTRFGLATRGAAENEPHAVSLGFDPLKIAATNWAMSGVVVSLLAVMTALLNESIDPSAVTLLVVAGLGAALIGGFSSFGLAILGGVGIGMGQALLQFLALQDWFPTAGGDPLPGVAQTLPFIVIVITLMIKGQGLPTRGAPEAIRLPEAPTPKFVLPGVAVSAVAIIFAMLFLDSLWRLAAINSMVGVCLCLSLVVLIGYVGQVSLAQVAIAGFAGFTLSRLTEAVGLGFPIAPVLAILGATLVGVLVAIPALRIRGVQLAAVTMAAALAIENFVFNNPIWAGGFSGAQVGSPTFLGFDFGPGVESSLGQGGLPSPWFGFFCFIVVLGIALAVTNVRRNATGRRMLAVRANERAAASLGVNVSQTKVVGFAIAALIAGTAGVLSGYRFGSVTSDYFGILQSFSILAFAYLGGISTVSGAVIGGMLVTNGIAFTALDKWLGISSEYGLLIGGLGLVITVVLNPDGISGEIRRLGKKFRSRGARDPGEGSLSEAVR